MNYKPNRKLKQYAREAFQLKPGMAVLASISIVIIQFASTYISLYLFPGNNILNLILGEIFSFALSVLTCVFEAGMYYMFLNLSRGKEPYFGQLLWFFSHEPDRVILASTVLAAIAWVTSLPVTIFSLMAKMPSGSEETLYNWYLNYSMKLMVLMFVCMGIGILVTVPLRMTYYILADEPEIRSTDALKKSCEMMKGNCGRFLLLQISFLPWVVISAFMMFIPLLFVLPYLDLSNVAFYRDLKGEFTFYHPPVQPVWTNEAVDQTAVVGQDDFADQDAAAYRDVTEEQELPMLSGQTDDEQDYVEYEQEDSDSGEPERDPEDGLTAGEQD